MIRFRRGARSSAPAAPVTSATSDQREKFLDDLAKSVLVQEHTSLRAEILASYGYAQSIVRWTLATFAAVAAAGLVALYNASTQNNTLLFAVALLIFGVGIPGIVWLNSWTWLGELYRAERAGSFLRRVESDLAAVPGLTERLGFEPARWERFIWNNRKARSLWGKQTITYLGTAGVFFGATTMSAIIFLILILQLLGNAQIEFLPMGLLFFIGAAAINLVGLIVCFVIFRRLMRLGEAVAPVDN